MLIAEVLLAHTKLYMAKNAGGQGIDEKTLSKPPAYAVNNPG
jgi:hypothetical protein